MRDILIQEDVKLIEARLKQFETNTGCELLLVVAASSDPYPAASLRFGMIGGFILGVIFSYYLEFHEGWMWPVAIFVFTLFMTWLGHFDWAKRLALSDWEVARECREKAIECFHTFGTSKVSHKVTAMIKISLLEKNIQILVDEKLKSEISQDELNELVELIKHHFKSGNICLGFISSIEKLENKILQSFKGKVSDTPPSELSDTIHFIQ